MYIFTMYSTGTSNANYLATLFILLSTHLTTADFLITRSQTCLGGFPLKACYTGPSVLTPATDFTCTVLEDALDNVFIAHGTVGFLNNGTLLSPHLESSHGLCGSGLLSFDEDSSGEYVVSDVGDGKAEGTVLGTCSFDDRIHVSCGLFLGAIGYLGTFRCSGLCD